MSRTTKIAFGNMLVGYGAGWLFPPRPMLVAAFAVQAIGGLIVVVCTERERLERESVESGSPYLES